jgi:hypothetical protein
MSTVSTSTEKNLTSGKSYGKSVTLGLTCSHRKHHGAVKKMQARRCVWIADSTSAAERKGGHGELKGAGASPGEGVMERGRPATHIGIGSSGPFILYEL